MPTLFIILGVSVWLAGMALAIVLPTKPSIVKITEKLVCPPETKLQVKTEVYSYHRPGQHAVHIFYTDEAGSDHNINGRALFALFMLFFTASLPFAAAVVLVIKHFIQAA